MPLTPIQTLVGHTDRVWTLAWNPSGSLLASSGGDKDIRLWAKQGELWSCVAILRDTHNKSIRRLCWSPCGNYIASASFDSTVCLWRKEIDEKSWKTIMNLEGHENEVKSVAWSHDGQYLASCGRDRTVWIWERAASGDDEDVDDAENWDCSDIRNDHTKDVKHIVWHPTANILVSCSYDDTVKFFHKDGDDWKCYQTLTSHTSTVWSAAFSATGEYLATAGDDKTVKVWKNHAHDKLPSVETSSWKCVSTLQGYHSRTIYDLAWCKNTDTIVSSSGDNSLVFYSKTRDDTTGQEVFICVDRTSQAHDCDINSVAFNNKTDGLLATAGDDRQIKIWSFCPSAEGTQQKTIVEDIMSRLKSTLPQSTVQSNQGSENRLTKTVTDFPNLFDLVQSLQLLQNELLVDAERISIGKLFDLDVLEPSLEPVESTSPQIKEDDGTVMEFGFIIKDSQGLVAVEIQVLVDRSQFKLYMPRRSTKFMTMFGDLFVLEKTGDLFKILPSGKTEFQLGHLFMFSDIKFIQTRDNARYVISADRDEKIRISRYPDTYEIESYCFGHKHFVRRILVVSDAKFVSIDQENNAILWDLKGLQDRSDKSFVRPECVLTLHENQLKRARVADKITRITA